MSRIVWLPAALFLLFAAPALAAGEPANPWWVGGYVGGYVEYGQLKFGRVIDTTAPAVRTLKDSGFSGGAVLGFSTAIDDAKKIMAGAEIDLYWPGLNDGTVVANGNIEEDIASGVNSCMSWALRFRLGREIWQNGLIYATAGPALLCLDLSTSFTGVAGSGKVHLWGFQVGGGLEHWWNEYFGVRAEYLYSDYEKETRSLVAPHIFKLNPRGHAVRAYLVIKIPGL